MRRMTLAARRTRQFLRRPPRPRWFRPAVYVGGALLGLAIGSGLGLWATEAGLVGQSGQALMDHVLAWSVQAGLAVRDVYVDGRVRTSQQALREQLGITVGQPVLAVDTNAVRRRLERLTWIDQASVVRLLPDSIYVRLIERQPLALWQREGRFSLVDRTGAVIEGVAPGAEYRDLRVLVGEGAPRRAADLFALFVDRTGAVRAGRRRHLGRRPTLEPASRQRCRRLAAGARCARGLAAACRQGARRGAARPSDLGHRPALPARSHPAPARSGGARGSGRMSLG